MTEILAVRRRSLAAIERPVTLVTRGHRASCVRGRRRGSCGSHGNSVLRLAPPRRRWFLAFCREFTPRGAVRGWTLAPPALGSRPPSERTLQMSRAWPSSEVRFATGPAASHACERAGCDGPRKAIIPNEDALRGWSAETCRCPRFMSHQVVSRWPRNRSQRSPIKYWPNG